MRCQVPSTVRSRQPGQTFAFVASVRQGIKALMCLRWKFGVLVVKFTLSAVGISSIQTRTGIDHRRDLNSGSSRETIFFSNAFAKQPLILPVSPVYFRGELRCGRIGVSKRKEFSWVIRATHLCTQTLRAIDSRVAQARSAVTATNKAVYPGAVNLIHRFSIALRLYKLA